MRARVGTCMSVSTCESCPMSLKRKFLPSNAAKNVASNRLLANTFQGAWSVVHNFGCRALYNLLRRASVSSHQVQYNVPTFKAYCEKICTSFLNDAESLKTYGCALWCSQIVYILPYSLNIYITAAFMDVRRNFSRGSKPTFCLSIFRLLTVSKRNWRRGEPPLASQI